MKFFTARKLSTITTVFWFLLIYIVAALVWWFISLHQQNERMTALLLTELKHDDPSYSQKITTIEEQRQRKNAQYIGEGLTFLVIILIGAVFVFRAARRKLRLSQQQQNFMMTVTHELKTPLSVAQLNLETIQKRQLDDAQKQRLISNTLQEVNRLTSLTSNILLASRFDAGEYKALKTEVDLSKLVKKVCCDIGKRSNNRTIITHIDGDVVITGEELLLELMLSNLIENAIKYSPPTTAVEVQLQIKGGNIQLCVSDEGTGIPDSEKEKIFDKFYRVGNEQTRSSKGTGLGLYLCKEIARSHGATIEVKDRKRGSSFIVTFNT